MEVYYLKLIWHLFYISIQKGAVSITILGEKLYSYFVLCTKATCWVICLFPGQFLLLRSPALPTHNYFVPSPSSKPNLCYYKFRWLLQSRLPAFRQRGWHPHSKPQRVPVLGASKITRSKLQKDDKWVSLFTKVHQLVDHTEAPCWKDSKILGWREKKVLFG